MGNVSSVNGKTTRFVATETKYQWLLWPGCEPWTCSNDNREYIYMYINVSIYLNIYFTDNKDKRYRM